MLRLSFRSASQAPDVGIGRCGERHDAAIDGSDAAWLGEVHLRECSVPAVVHGPQSADVNTRCIEHDGFSGEIQPARSQHRSHAGIPECF